MKEPLDIKIFVSCHQPDQTVPPHPLLVPMQVGTALTRTKFSGFAYDNTGENISSKNKVYCELTAQYWAWKNVEADYYGFFHYRRYLFPGCHTNPACIYTIKSRPTLALLNALGYEKFQDIIADYDLIVPRGEDMRISVRQHYARARDHHQDDLDLVERVIEEQYPKYTHAKDTYLSNSICYFGNIFIMHKDLFHSYCQWMFPILAQFEQSKDISQYSISEKRVAGYLGERLLGIFVTYQRQNSNLNILELPRVHFEDNWVKRARQMLFNDLLPPGSRKRAVVKSIIYHHQVE